MRKLIPAVTALSALLSIGAVAQDQDHDWDKSQVKHVLLISIDGMHATDFKNCVEGIAGANDSVGVIYTGSAKKQEEHGGFAHDDTNVMLLLSNPAFRPHTVFSEVGTLQVAPTILKALGLDPHRLDGVRLEGTGVLPDVNLNFDQH